MGQFVSLTAQPFSARRWRLHWTLAAIGVVLALSGCVVAATNQYSATACVTYTWRVEYAINPQKPATTRVVNFASTSMLNRNGLKPADAVTGPDDHGLWWPGLPPRPTVNQIEQRQQPLEKASLPHLLKSVKYQLTYQTSGKSVTLPTNYQVYRQVVKAYPSKQPLKFILGLGQTFVLQAEPQ